MPTKTEHKTSLRVRYGETDQMGYVYYGRYAEYFEVARVEAMRNLGISYRKLEEEGIMLPVSRLEVKYAKPIHYDEKIDLVTTVQLVGKTFIRFETMVKNEHDELSTTGVVTLCFIDKESRLPIEPPEYVKDKLV